MARSSFSRFIDWAMLRDGEFTKSTWALQRGSGPFLGFRVTFGHDLHRYAIMPCCFAFPLSVPFFAVMIVSDSDSATPPSNSRQADHSASGRTTSHTQSSRPSPSAVPSQKQRRLRKQFPSPPLADEGSRVELDENIMALCHCQITDRGFADATDMVGPSIEVLRPTKTQTALDAPSGFFTVHLASLKKGLRFPLHPLLIEFLNLVDLLPCQLVPNSHRYIAGYLVRCKDVGVKPTLDHFLFTFKLTKGHKDWASYASLSQRYSKLFTSDKKGSTKDWKPFFVFVSTGTESPFTGSGRPSFCRVPCPPSDATLAPITRQLCNKGAMNIKEVVSEESLAGLGFEFVQDELRHQPDLLRDNPRGSRHDQLRDTPRGGLDCGPFVESPELDEEMDGDLLLSRFTAGKKRKRETKSQGKRSSSHREESPPREPTVIVVEDQDDVALKRSRQAALDEAMRAAEVRQKELQEEVARLTRELEEKESRCAALVVEKASHEDRCIALEADKASLSSEGGLDPYEFCRRLPRRQWPSVKPPPIPPNPYEDFGEAYKALSANRLPDWRIDWDAPCPLHSLQCMAWESFHDEHLPLLEHECAYYTSLERWTNESRTSSPVRPKDEVVVGEEQLGSSLPRPTGCSPPRKAP
ncbi:unnamed protein product [Cuscuta campestris]|uniref:Transposase (putative) gypsy type domain-containing protein n=1 Tax=Cuscuta campestris TaxID=132261 RepID=A0A484LS06_9ASTE|nr:unnamed protein product [Cuscuta campestris]